MRGWKTLGGAIIVALAWAGSAVAADDYKQIDCAKSEITFSLPSVKCDRIDAPRLSGSWVSYWRAEYRGGGRYLAGLLNVIEAGYMIYTMAAIRDATLVRLAKQQNPISIGDSREVGGVKQLPYTLKNGTCASWVKGGDTNRAGQFTSYISGVFCVPPDETLDDKMFKLFLSEVQVNGKPVGAPPD